MNQYFFFLLITSISSFAQDVDNKEIHDVFFKYKKALQESNGFEAVTHITNSTLTYYDDMVIASLTMDSVKVRALPTIDRYNVLAIRHTIPAREVFKMQGRDLFVYLMSKGLSDKNSMLYNKASMQDEHLGDITVSENGISAIVQFAQCKLPICLIRFDKENGIWKMDLSSFFKGANTMINIRMKNLGLTTDEYILQALEAFSGKKPGNTIWKPLK